VGAEDLLCATGLAIERALRPASDRSLERSP